MFKSFQPIGGDYGFHFIPSEHLEMTQFLHLLPKVGITSNFTNVGVVDGHCNDAFFVCALSPPPEKNVKPLCKDLGNESSLRFRPSSSRGALHKLEDFKNKFLMPSFVVYCEVMT